MRKSMRIFITTGNMIRHNKRGMPTKYFILVTFFLGPYKGDYRQQIEIMIGAWKPIGGTSQFSEVKQYAIDGRRSEYVFQLSPENNFAIVIAYGTDQGSSFFTESIPLGKIGPVETLLMQLVDCEIPYFVSNE